MNLLPNQSRYVENAKCANISRRDDDKANLLTHNWTIQLDISTGVCGISTSLAAIVVYNGELPLSRVLVGHWASMKGNNDLGDKKACQ